MWPFNVEKVANSRATYQKYENKSKCKTFFDERVLSAFLRRAIWAKQKQTGDSLRHRPKDRTSGNRAVVARTSCSEESLKKQPTSGFKQANTGKGFKENFKGIWNKMQMFELNEKQIIKPTELLFYQNSNDLWVGWQEYDYRCFGIVEDSRVTMERPLVSVCCHDKCDKMRGGLVKKIINIFALLLDITFFFLSPLYSLNSKYFLKISSRSKNSHYFVYSLYFVCTVQMS